MKVRYVRPQRGKLSLNVYIGAMRPTELCTQCGSSSERKACNIVTLPRILVDCMASVVEQLRLSLEDYVFAAGARATIVVMREKN